jgi:4-carboxymuconolactone decarboxylase
MDDSKTLTERAVDVLTTLTGSEQTARAISEGLDTRGALGQVGFYNGFGAIWGRTELSRRDRSLTVISFQVALGLTGELDFHLNGGLNHGLSVEELDEVVVQIAAYAGAARGLAAAGVLDAVLAKRHGTDSRPQPPARLEIKEPPQRRADGLDVLRTLGAHHGLSSEQQEERILESYGFMGELILDWAFGDVWSRPQLSRRDRSLVVVSALAALDLQYELEIHLQGALNHGLTRTEIEEIMITLVLYGGFPRAIDGFNLARRVFERADRETGNS